ncbi:hypothetical protein VP1G_06208 [Cytospora mali]|uniref:Uncharacterized protein n=1 Tax=Cytospora mali TaxID=578113 RepID=A0A194V4M7_CYTMA|nr:hypothetical protein VP1G_06208 [Valsa mali var. pyri (nom. inval.)]
MDGRQHPSELTNEYSPARTSDDSGPSILRNSGGYGGECTVVSEGDCPERYFENNDVSPRALEDGYSVAATLSTVSAAQAAKMTQTQQFPQFYRDETRKPPVRDTMISGISGVTAGSGAPMLPKNPKSAFEEDAPKAQRKFHFCGIGKSNFFIVLVLLLFLLVVGVAIAVGVGMSLSKTSESSPYSKRTNSMIASTT